eukprot:Plantae.Rhodophyta-Hildenbrandia_rubra.ctg15903.p1 GENE.Plantae.Rhodophyta-Hildenbrandia_rubra.ctg15903~~Plantae.Rhodophyta-Hildenbrandia_rubra.ctg15903.p1  ORF type:complete len:319 (+),score=64.07 Plantae.Rhodophyta-Hildenbrandia_rubra.ctg15903:229-1185(+)
MSWGLGRGASTAITALFTRSRASPSLLRSESSFQTFAFPSLSHRIHSANYGTNAEAGPGWHGTTILAVRRNKKVTVIGDGQVTMGSVVVKPNARKVRRLGLEGEVVAGFAGATADAMTLFERLESKIEEYPGQLLRSCVSLAKDWRMDKYLRRLDAMLLVCDKDISLYLSGTGDVLEPTDGVIGIGSGGSYAIAAARALIGGSDLDTEDIAKRSMEIAADMCVYTNNSFVVENLTTDSPKIVTNGKKAGTPNGPKANGVPNGGKPVDGIKENGEDKKSGGGKEPKATGVFSRWSATSGGANTYQELGRNGQQKLSYGS